MSTNNDPTEDTTDEYEAPPAYAPDAGYSGDDESGIDDDPGFDPRPDTYQDDDEDTGDTTTPDDDDDDDDDGPGFDPRPDTYQPDDDDDDDGGTTAPPSEEPPTDDTGDDTTQPGQSPEQPTDAGTDSPTDSPTNQPEDDPTVRDLEPALQSIVRQVDDPEQVDVRRADDGDAQLYVEGDAIADEDVGALAQVAGSVDDTERVRIEQTPSGVSVTTVGEAAAPPRERDEEDEEDEFTSPFDPERRRQERTDTSPGGEDFEQVVDRDDLGDAGTGEEAFDPNDFDERSEDPDPFSQVDAGQAERNVEQAMGGEVSGMEIGGAQDEIPIDTQRQLERQLENQTVTDLEAFDIRVEREVVDGETVVRARLSQEARRDEQQARQELRSTVNEREDRQVAGINRRAVDAFTGGEGVSAADEVLAERELERQLEEQTGADLEAGEDFEVEQTGDGFQAELTESGQQRLETQAEQQAAQQIDQQLDEQVGADLERGEDYTLERTDEGYRAELTDEGRERVARSNEDFGDIPVESPVSDNRLETDLRRADEWWQKNIGEAAGEIGAVPFTLGRPEEAPEGARERGEFFGGAAEGGANVFSPAGIALEGKEIGEFVLTQPQRVFETGGEQTDQISTEQDGSAAGESPSGLTNVAIGAARRAPVSVDEEGAEQFSADVEERAINTLEAASEAYEANPERSVGQVVGGLATAAVAGSAAARRVPGVSGSDLSGRVALGAARGVRRMRGTGRRFARAERAQAQIPRGRVDADADSGSGLPDEIQQELDRFETQTRIRRGRERAEEEFIKEQVEAGRRQERSGEPYTSPGQESARTVSRQENIYRASESDTTQGARRRRQRARRSSFDDDLDLSPRESQLAAQMDTPETDLRTAIRSGELIDESGAVRAADEAAGGATTGSTLRFGVGAGLGTSIGTGALTSGGAAAGLDSEIGARGDVGTRTDARAATGVDARQDVLTDVFSRSDLAFDTRSDLRGDSRADSRQDTRFDVRADARMDSRQDLRGDARGDSRQDLRADTRGDVDDEIEDDDASRRQLGIGEEVFDTGVVQSLEELDDS